MQPASAGPLLPIFRFCQDEKEGIAEDCRIKFKRKNRRKCTSRKMKVPAGNGQGGADAGSSRLVMWAQQTFGAVTSYSEVDGRAIQFYVGRDSSAESSCDVTSLSTSQRAFTHREVPVPLRGCHSEDLGKIINTRSFIIEMLDQPPPSPGIDGLDMDIEAYDGPSLGARYEGPQQAMVAGGGPLLRELALRNRDGAGKEVDFDLVIKTPERLKWKLHSRSISRRIGIVSNSQHVKTNGIKISEMVFREEVIPGSGADLVKWTNNFVSTTWLYVGVRGANTFKLRVPPKDHKMGRSSNTGAQSTAPFPGMKDIGQSDAAETNGEGERQASTGDVTPRSGVWGAGDKVGRSTWDDQGDGGQFASLGVVKTECVGKTMEVQLRKSFVETHGLDKGQMYLGSPECVSTSETETSVVFRAPFSQCGMTTSEMSGKNAHLYKSRLVIKTPPGLRSQLLMEEVGSGYMKDGDQGAHGADPELDSEDDIAEPGSGLQDRDFGGMYDDEDFGSPDNLQDSGRSPDQNDNITFDVQCVEEYDPTKLRKHFKDYIKEAKGTVAKSPQASPNGPQVSMIVSNNPWIDKAFTSLPVEVKPDEQLYIKASLTNKDATLLVDSCWFSSSVSPYNRSALPSFFIQQGCNFDIKGMQWQDDPSGDNMNLRKSQFHFNALMLQRLGVDERSPPVYLHCKYRDCQRTDRLQAAQCPVLPNDRCKLYENPSSRMAHETSYYGPLTIGPFVAKALETGTSISTGSPSSNGFKNWFNSGAASKAEMGKSNGLGPIFLGSPKRDPAVVGTAVGSIPGDARDGRQAVVPPQQLIIVEGLDPFLAVGIAFATFVLGIILVASIWCIHTRTGDHHASSSSSSTSSSSPARSSSSSPPLLRCWCKCMMVYSLHEGGGLSNQSKIGCPCECGGKRRPHPKLLFSDDCLTCEGQGQGDRGCVDVLRSG
ncbi:hypothetical protein EGW08_005106 [Elysia chlorotica]|uniref:ZP domain-containing protein n=1 Tax=Elysia chlorotica TaxID=188477 RepID=A0A3S1AAY7_ELYCH|nr:hypothetical protein EGW08_005106 [Elysia chlorotica]